MYHQQYQNNIYKRYKNSNRTPMHGFHESVIHKKTDFKVEVGGCYTKSAMHKQEEGKT